MGRRPRVSPPSMVARSMVARSTSLWSATMPPERCVHGTPLDADRQVDVAIVGAGFTGLWTALAARDPTLRIAVLERHEVGFGASGRNGGWCSALLAASLDTYAAAHGRDAAIAAQRAMHDTVLEVGHFLATADDDAGWHRGGTISYARTPAQLVRLESELATARRYGFGEDELRWLTDDELDAAGRPPGTTAALFTPHCAAVHPLRLVHAVARAVLARGVALHTHTPVVEISPPRLVTPAGVVTAEVTVLATEAYTATFEGQRRAVAPVYSSMVGSVPLTDEQWARVGLHDRPTFHDARHVVVYGQRTADGRLAFGGRGAPYHFGSRIDPSFDRHEGVRRKLVATVRELFPAVADVEFPFHWGGPLGVPRDWRWTARVDRRRGIAVAGGYVGDGVATTNLAGRTLADLILRRDTDLVRLPWVGHHSRRWEPEPLRWLGINLARVAAARADRAEARTGTLARREAAWWSRLLDTLTGH